MSTSSGRSAAEPGGLRFLFDCGSIADLTSDAIVLQVEEIGDVPLGRSPRRPTELLSGPVGRRVGRALAATTGTVYLEEGMPVAGVTGGTDGADPDRT